LKVLKEALELIKSYDTRMYARIHRQLNGIWIYWVYSNARYVPQWKLCALDEDALCAPGTTAVQVAGWIVHEATHARLHAAGIGYDSQNMERIERICVRAQLAFAERVPGGEAQIAEAEAMLDRESNVWTAAQRHAELVRRLELLNAPAWFIRWARRRAHLVA
jgi:hypothetical protein